MKRDDKNQTKKIIVRVRIGGKKKPVTKEAVVCSKSGKIMKFLQNTFAEAITFNKNNLLKNCLPLAVLHY